MFETLTQGEDFVQPPTFVQPSRISRSWGKNRALYAILVDPLTQ
jgi:hypothetical protein